MDRFNIILDREDKQTNLLLLQYCQTIEQQEIILKQLKNMPNNKALIIDNEKQTAKTFIIGGGRYGI